MVILKILAKIAPQKKQEFLQAMQTYAIKRSNLVIVRELMNRPTIIEMLSDLKQSLAKSLIHIYF